jgi:hypothetical protein
MKLGLSFTIKNTPEELIFEIKKHDGKIESLGFSHRVGKKIYKFLNKIYK